jgi:hypothetical protein
MMFKKILVIFFVVFLSVLLIAGAVNRTLIKNGQAGGESVRQGLASESTHDQQDAFLSVEGVNKRQGIGNSSWSEGRTSRTHEDYSGLPAAPEEINPADVEALVFMREEEKLARDLYLSFYELWGLNTFQNIARSEQLHSEAVFELINQYGVSDPFTDQIGVFTNPDLQELYDRLLAQGSQSLLEAIKVGAAVEEIDILDLESHLAQTENPAVQQVFNNLLRGSNNHLRTYSVVFQKQSGEVYIPQYLDQYAYQDIVGAESESNGPASGQGLGYRGGRP